MKDKIVELLRYAYLWGRDNGEGRSEKNFNDFLETKEKAIAQLYSAGEEVSDGAINQASYDRYKYNETRQLAFHEGAAWMRSKLTRPTVSEEEKRELLVHFLDSLRAYEHESHNLLGHDERESSEFVDIYFKELNR